MKRLIVMAVFVLVFITTSAQAADKGKGMYFSANLGVSLLSDSTVDMPGVFNGEISHDTGLIIGGALGYNFGAFRAEGEIAYRTNDTDEGTLVGIPGSGPVTGDVNSISFMVNGYYDFHLAKTPLVPYLGVGLGFANISYDVTAPTLSTLALIDDNDTVFAYQIMAGLGYNINPTMTLTLDYRYFAASDPELSPGPAFIPGLPNIKEEYDNHSFNFGARYMF